MMRWLGRLAVACVMAVLGSLVGFYLFGELIVSVLMLAKPVIPLEAVDTLMLWVKRSLGLLSLAWGLLGFWVGFRMTRPDL